jgi:hypothetical protein
MIILSTSAVAQEVKVIPREYIADFSLSLRDDSTNVLQTYEITNASTVGNYLVFSNIFNLVANHFYDITLQTAYSFWNTNFKLWQNETTLWNVDDADDMIIYKDRIFCTDQDVTDNKMYDINKDQYNTYNGYDNTYIVR